MNGMMLAQRPGDGGSMSSGPASMGGGNPSVSIGNYKGVMLCNRPFAGVSGAARAGAGGGAVGSSFTCGTVSDPVGSNIPISNRQVKQAGATGGPGTKKDSALSKHRKWLSDLQRTKDRLELQYLEEIQSKEESKRQFMDREAKMRQAVRTQKRAADGGFEDPADSDAGPGMMAAEPRPYDDATAPDVAEAKGGGGGGGAPSGAGSDDKDDKGSAASAAADSKAEAKLLTRPMWAMTEDDAKVAVELKDDAEADSLLAFASSLDFDKYIDDMEIQAMIDQVKSKIASLETDLEKEELEKQLAALEAANPTPRVEALTADALAKHTRRGGGGSDAGAAEGKEDDVMSEIARSILGSDAKAGAVHSTKSMAAVVSKRLDGVPEEPALPAPRIVTHTDRAELTASKDDVSNLPYMHRHPAI